jgi:hypothetical protein
VGVWNRWCTVVVRGVTRWMGGSEYEKGAGSRKEAGRRRSRGEAQRAKAREPRQALGLGFGSRHGCDYDLSDFGITIHKRGQMSTLPVQSMSLCMMQEA